MNCEKYQNLLSDFIDGSLAKPDHDSVEIHLINCKPCAEARGDLVAIVGYCREHRGEYDAVPNERALWLRISNTIESELAVASPARIPPGTGWWFRLMNRSWELSFPQMAAAVAVLVIMVGAATTVGLRRFNFGGGSGVQSAGASLVLSESSVDDRYRQRKQVIAYWNQRVELNKQRWNPQMRETFDRNMSVIDAAVNDSMDRLKQNPHDEVSEEILNAALTDKVALLKEFSEL
ncbi:MAG: anti-sigma factor [Acidobacteriota bacterium]